MNKLVNTQNRALWRVPVHLNLPMLESLNQRGQIVTLGGAKFALNQGREKTTLHPVTMV